MEELWKKAKIGEIWVAVIPKIYYDDRNDEVQINIERRPCLIVDDGRGFLIEENSNYSALKLTTRKSHLETVNRKELKNWKELGLKRKSYVRIELPIKIEPEQLVKKITKLSNEEMRSYLKELASIFNTEILNELVKEKTSV